MSIVMVERCIVHDKHGLLLWPSAAAKQQLPDEVLEKSGISRTSWGAMLGQQAEGLFWTRWGGWKLTAAINVSSR